MTDQITENNRVFPTIYANYVESKTPPQFALELQTTDRERAEQLKQQILSNQKVVERLKSLLVDPWLGHINEKLQMYYKDAKNNHVGVLDFSDGVTGMIRGELQKILDGKES